MCLLYCIILLSHIKHFSCLPTVKSNRSFESFFCCTTIFHWPLMMSSSRISVNLFLYHNNIRKRMKGTQMDTELKDILKDLFHRALHINVTANVVYNINDRLKMHGSAM